MESIVVICNSLSNIGESKTKGSSFIKANIEQIISVSVLSTFSNYGIN